MEVINKHEVRFNKVEDGAIQKDNSVQALHMAVNDIIKYAVDNECIGCPLHNSSMPRHGSCKLRLMDYYVGYNADISKMKKDYMQKDAVGVC